MESLICPVCGNASVEPLLEDVKITATLRGGKSPVGGLVAYRCTQEGHIFFVRQTDLPEGQSAATG